MRRSWRRTPLVPMVVLGSACGVTDTDDPVQIASIAVTPQSLEVTAGGTAALEAELTDVAGNVVRGRRIVWASSKPAIARVSENGVVTGVTAGRAEVAATAEGKSDVASITVVPVPVSAVTVTPASVTIGEGKSTTLAAKLTDAAGNILTGRVITWSSSDTRIVTVEQSGVVRGIRKGQAVITATAEAKFGTSSIRVQ